VVLVSQVATAVYFAFFLVAMPLARWLDRDVVETPIPRVAQEEGAESEPGPVGGGRAAAIAEASAAPERR
jgi:hypothetical protein